MRQQLGNPGGIPLVGLLARPPPDIVALGHTHLDRFMQYMIHWLPGDARTLHGHHRTPVLLQPGAKGDQLTVGGPTDTPSIIGVVIQKLSPLTSGAASQLKTLSESGSQEVKVLAQAMFDIAQRSQLVIGHSVLTKDLRKFLQRGGIEP
jgi:hypothetical protein